MHRLLSRFQHELRYALALCLVLLATAAQAARPVAPQLLPEDTLVLVRVTNTTELKEDFLKTALGRMLQDKQVAPLLEQLYGIGIDSIKTFQDQLGISVSEVLSLFQGELAIGLVPLAEGPPAAVLVMDVGKQTAVANKLLKLATSTLEAQGAMRIDEDLDGFDMASYMMGNRSVSIIQKEGTVVVGTSPVPLRKIAGMWAGDKGKILNDNTRYAAIMKRCQGSKDHPPQVTWYVDPIAIAKNYARGNLAARISLGLLPSLGLDGVDGVGGSFIFGDGEYDTVTHIHLLLDNPRAGLVKALAFGVSDAKPERWVPADVSTYATINWRVEKSFEAVKKVADSFYGEDYLSNLIESRLSIPLGFDVEGDVLRFVDGRFTTFTWVEKPVVNTQSQASFWAIKLKDEKAFAKKLERILEQPPYSQYVERKSLVNVPMYQVNLPRFNPNPNAEGDGDVQQLPVAGPFGRTAPVPVFCVFEDYLMIADRAEFLKKVLTDKDNPAKSLAGNADFKLIAEKVARVAGDKKPSVISFSRPDESLRLWYELATRGESRDWLQQQGENLPILQSVDAALGKNPLPPFAAIAKYFAPSGGMLVDDDTGVHYTAFTLKKSP